MLKKIDYKIRANQLLNYVNDINAGRLVTNPFFQRNLVWREIHKKEFIETILLGYPFPQIFLSKGKIDLEKKISVASIVDGQQRTNAITEFLEDKFNVNGKFFSELTDAERESFYKYEIAFIELDLENDSPQVQEIFQRINRTSNSLTGIEKKASEYNSSEYMLVCQLLTDHLNYVENEDEDEDEEIVNIRSNPYITDDFKSWSKTIKISNYKKIITNDSIFTPNEMAKKVNLMYTINLVTTFLCGIYNRNERAWEFADIYKDKFKEKDDVVKVFEKTSIIFNQLKLTKKSIWHKKANFFSLFLVLANLIKIGETFNIEKLKNILNNFEPSEEYKLAAKEGVNNLKERTLREKTIKSLVTNAINN